MHTHLAGPLVSAFFMGASICAVFPGVMSYISIVKQHAAAAAGGAVQAVTFICGGLVRGVVRLSCGARGGSDACVDKPVFRQWLPAICRLPACGHTPVRPLGSP
jgi:hypothetical protein